MTAHRKRGKGAPSGAPDLQSAVVPESRVDPALDAVGAVRAAHKAYGKSDDDCGPAAATFIMALNRFWGTKPTTGAGIAEGLRFFIDNENGLEQLSAQQLRWLRLVIEGARGIA